MSVVHDTPGDDRAAVGSGVDPDLPNAPLLFLGHAADRTGPPIYLLHFLRWLRAHHPEVDFEIALLAGGELEDDFRELGPRRMSVYQGLPPSPWDAVERAYLLRNLQFEDMWWSLRRKGQIRRQMRQHAGCRVVHVNSAASAEMARLLPPGDRILLSHVHELEVGLTHRCSAADRAVLLEEASQVFVVADAVGRNVVERHGVDPGAIARHPGMVDLRDVAMTTRDDQVSGRAEARRSRGLPADGLIVGSCGTLDWRKAVDLFLRVAWHLTRQPRSEPLTFVWVGGRPEDVARAEGAAAQLGVDDVVRFVGLQSDPVDWFRLMDVFVLPAREDPFPLVCLEAAAVGVPTVSFDNGGMPELLHQGCGLVALYPDVADFAAKVDELLVDPEKRRSLGERGSELIAANHDVAVLAPLLWADIERWIR